MKTKRYVKSWIKAFGEVSEDHLRFSIALIQSLVENGPVNLNSIEESTGMNMRRLKNFAKKRPRTYFNEDHKIVGHGAVSIEESREKLEVGDKVFYASNSWDALSAVFYIDQPLIWKSKCDVSGEDVEVKVLPEGIETEQEGIYLSFLHPDALNFERLDTMSDWCVTLLGDGAAESYLEAHPDRLAIPLSQSYQFVRDAFYAWVKPEQ